MEEPASEQSTPRVGPNDLPASPSTPYDDALETCGGSSRSLLLPQIILIGVVYSSVVACIKVVPYGILEPISFSCRGGGTCSRAEACAEQDQFGHVPIPQYGPSEVRSWISGLGLVCSPSKGSYLASAYPLGYVLGALATMSLSDFVGRKSVVGLSGKGQRVKSSKIPHIPYVRGTMTITNPTRRTHIRFKGINKNTNFDLYYKV